MMMMMLYWIHFISSADPQETEKDRKQSSALIIYCHGAFLATNSDGQSHALRSVHPRLRWLEVWKLPPIWQWQGILIDTVRTAHAVSLAIFYAVNTTHWYWFSFFFSLSNPMNSLWRASGVLHYLPAFWAHFLAWTSYYSYNWHSFIWGCSRKKC